MAYFWLNQRDEIQGYSDIEGEVYHYRSNVPGHRKLSDDDYFIYYRPAEYLIFGAGIIGEIETKELNPGQENGMLTNYYAHINSYVDFNPALQVREIKNRISFLKDRDGLRGVPQNSIYEIGREDYAETLRAAGGNTSLQNP